MSRLRFVVKGSTPRSHDTPYPTKAQLDTRCLFPLFPGKTFSRYFHLFHHDRPRQPVSSPLPCALATKHATSPGRGHYPMHLLPRSVRRWKFRRRNADRIQQVLDHGCPDGRLCPYCSPILYEIGVDGIRLGLSPGQVDSNDTRKAYATTRLNGDSH